MNKFKLALLSSVIVSLIGCSADDQDDPSSNEVKPINVSGVVIDPYIRAATVFADYNENGVLDTFEPWALSDDDGYFGLSKSGEDYCQSNMQHCLTLSSNEKVMLVAAGGYDSTTLERVTTRMSASYPGEGTQVISPLTSLITASIEEDFDKNINFMSSPFGDETAIVALQLAFDLHKRVEILSQVLTPEYSAIGNNELLPTDLSGFVYQAINQVATEQAIELNEFLQKNTENQYELILDNARTRLNEAYEKAGVSLFSNNSVSKRQQAPAIRSEIASNSELSSFFTAFEPFLVLRFERALESDTIAELPFIQAGTLRQIQLVVNQAKNSLMTNRDINADTMPIIDIFNAYEGTSLTDSFGRDTYDSSLWDLANSASQSAMENTLALMATRTELPNLVGNKTLTLEERTSTRDAKIIFYFDGELSGDLSACIYYQDLTDADNFNNSDGVLFTGSWSKQDYQLFLTLNVASAPQALRIKSGLGTSFVFDYDNKDRAWDGINAFETISGAIPTSNSQCQEQLQ